MKRNDPRVYGLEAEVLRAFLSTTSTDCPAADLAKLKDLLNRFPIRHRRICLIAPPQLNPNHVSPRMAKLRAYMAYLPYGLLTLSAAIQLYHPEWQVDILDLNIEALRRAHVGDACSREILLQSIPDGYDAYGVTWMFKSVELETLAVLSELKKREALVIAGGVQATAEARILVEKEFADIVCQRESERTLGRLLDLWEGREIDDLANLMFRSGGEVVELPAVFYIPGSLDIRPEFDIVDHHTCIPPSIWCRTAGCDRKFANVLSNRGCCGACMFCSVSTFMDRGVRNRHPQDVIDEIVYLYEEKGVRHIEWLDDELLANRDRALALFNGLAALDLDLSWSTFAFVLAISVDEEMADAMARSGCVMTGFGVETGNAERLKASRKPATLDAVTRAAGIFKRNHPQIMLTASFILGFPEETFAELMDTFNFANNLQVDWCIHSILQPLMTTPIYGQFMTLGDERTIDSFGKGRTTAFTVGRDALSKGRTFDDLFDDVIDFRDIELDRVATPLELKQFQIYFNVFVNLVGNVNLTEHGNPEKVLIHSGEVAKAYPMDPVLWGVNARAAAMLGRYEQAEASCREYERALGESWFWRRFFEVYNVAEHLELEAITL